MNIALVSYEYPSVTGGGGIGTYIANSARMLARRGHHVEVFAGGEASLHSTTSEGAHINRIDCLDREAFAESIVPCFSERHAAVEFDIVEGPEYYAEARGINNAFPKLPLVVRLHTASCVLQEVNVNRNLTWWDKARFLLGGLRGGEVPSPYWTYDSSVDREHHHTLEADVVSAPSQSIAKLMAEWWELEAENIECFPNPFEATDAFLNIDSDTNTNRITFIGRLEMRKGVLDLAQAIPYVLHEHSDARFRFIGRSLDHPKTGEDLRTSIESELHSYSESIEFTGSVPYEQIPYYLADTDLCVFPSLWENFPNVCLEAMSAARGVVGSSAGGMKEMLGDGMYGRVVPPEDPESLADAILDLLRHPEERKRLGRAARDRVLTTYSYEAIAPQQEACYAEAIRRNESQPT